MLYCLWSVLLVVSGQGLGGGTAGDEDFNDGVATQAVAAVDAAGHLASRIRPGMTLLLVSRTWRPRSTQRPPMVW